MDFGNTPERRKLAAIFAQLRNVPRLTAFLDPGRVMDLAREFFDLGVRHTGAHQGRMITVHSSFLSLFPSAAEAVNAAKAMQRDFQSMGERCLSQHGLAAAVALGGHVGEAVVGRTGPSGAEPQYVALGDCMNMLERLTTRARAGEIILSAEAVQATGVFPAALGATRLPPLELWQQPAIGIYGILLDKRIDLS